MFKPQVDIKLSASSTALACAKLFFVKICEPLLARLAAIKARMSVLASIECTWLKISAISFTSTAVVMIFCSFYSIQT